MKAVQFAVPGTPASVLKTVDVEKPRPGDGEVLVRMLASPVNPSDLMFVRGKYTIPASCPAIPGFEGVGVVEQSGGGIRGRLFQGRRVVVLNKRGGNWAEFAVVPSSQVVPVSRRLSVEQAATFFVNPATAWVMTREVLCVPPGAWLLQTAAGSALGRMVIRLARHCGFRTFNVVRRSSVAEALRGLGGDHVEVFDGTEENAPAFEQAVRRVLGETGVRYAIDAVGGSTGSALVRCLGSGGRLLAYGTLSGQPLQFSPRTLMTVEGRVEGFWLGHYMNSKKLLFRLRLVRRLTQLIQSGVLDSEPGASFSLEDVARAVIASEDSSLSGKTLLRIAGR